MSSDPSQNIFSLNFKTKLKMPCATPRKNSRCQPFLTCALVVCLGGAVMPCSVMAQGSGQTSDKKPAASVDKAAPPAKTAASSSLDNLPNPTYIDDGEVKLGRLNAEQNDKQVKLITDSAIVERVNRIGQELARIANLMPIPATWGSSQLKPFKYSFKVVDDKDVNAYSLPGGFIYVHKGLIDAVHSDDELAGVLAHEIAHAAHHHVLKLMREQQKIENILIPLELLAVAAAAAKRGGQGGQAAQQVLMAGNLYTTAKVNGYGIQAEEDADHAGLLLMTHSRYNPVGLYSFMIRLAALERQKGVGDLGIFRTHPPAPERVENAKNLLGKLNIPIRLADVDPSIRATVTALKDGDYEMAEIKVRGLVICRVIGEDGVSAMDRATAIGKKLTSLIDDKLQPFEIKVSRDQTRIVARNITLLTDADAGAQNKTMADFARQIADAIAQVSQKQQLENGP
jgi:Zn-dependent protease with chaperone function